jgi:TatD DNase family protein
MNQLFDIACNFTHESFNKDLDDVFSTASEAGVNKFLVVSAELNDQVLINKIVRKNNNCYFTTGVHPHHAKTFNKNSISTMRDLIVKNNPHAIGEMGLDFFRNISSYDEQIYAFEEQIKLAIEFNKPLFLHQRDSHESFIKLINKYSNDINKAVVHCFTGTQNQLEDYLNNDFYIGLTGWICDERRNKDLRASIKNIPLNRLMIETDSPYLIPRNLSPKPKNNRNEPKNLKHIAQEIADLREESLETICKSTFKNSINFFNRT